MESEMSSRPLTPEEVRIVREAGLMPFTYTNRGAKVYSSEDIVAAQQEREVKLARANAEYYTSQEFRDDVMLELMEAGATLEQATNRTRDQVRLFAEARTLNMM
jgi:hypothetical protein